MGPAAAHPADPEASPRDIPGCLTGKPRTSALGGGHLADLLPHAGGPVGPGRHLAGEAGVPRARLGTSGHFWALRGGDGPWGPARPPRRECSVLGTRLRLRGGSWGRKWSSSLTLLKDRGSALRSGIRPPPVVLALPDGGPRGCGRAAGAGAVRPRWGASGGAGVFPPNRPPADTNGHHRHRHLGSAWHPPEMVLPFPPRDEGRSELHLPGRPTSSPGSSEQGTSGGRLCPQRRAMLESFSLSRLGSPLALTGWGPGMLLNRTAL